MEGHEIPPAAASHDHRGTAPHTPCLLSRKRWAQACLSPESVQGPSTARTSSHHLSPVNNTNTQRSEITETQEIITAKMAVAQSAEFKKAVEDSRKLKAKPSDDELLQVCIPIPTPTLIPPLIPILSPYILLYPVDERRYERRYERRRMDCGICADMDPV